MKHCKIVINTADFVNVWPLAADTYEIKTQQTQHCWIECNIFCDNKLLLYFHLLMLRCLLLKNSRVTFMQRFAAMSNNKDVLTYLLTKYNSGSVQISAKLKLYSQDCETRITVRCLTEIFINWHCYLPNTTARTQCIVCFGNCIPLFTSMWYERKQTKY